MIGLTDFENLQIGPLSTKAVIALCSTARQVFCKP